MSHRNTQARPHRPAANSPRVLLAGAALAFVVAMAPTAATAEPDADRQAATSSQSEQPAPQGERQDGRGNASDTLPELDDLLGLPGEEREGTGKGDLLDPAREELERRLSGQDATSQFHEAVAMMAQTATRLSQARDTGLTTQRLQERILRKLDQVIESAERQEQQGGQSSSDPDQQQDEQVQPDQQQASAGEADGGDGDQETLPPARRDGPLRPGSVAGEAAWGALPERVRDALRQGASDNFSSMYRSLTEEYYRRLAEEPER